MMSHMKISDLQEISKTFAYNLGDRARPCDMKKTESKNERLYNASMLEEGDGAFILRSDNSWRFAIVAKKIWGDEPMIEFVVDVDGSTKLISRKRWSTFVCGTEKSIKLEKWDSKGGNQDLLSLESEKDLREKSGSNEVASKPPKLSSKISLHRREVYCIDDDEPHKSQRPFERSKTDATHTAKLQKSQFLLITPPTTYLSKASGCSSNELMTYKIIRTQGFFAANDAARESEKESGKEHCTTTSIEHQHQQEDRLPHSDYFSGMGKKIRRYDSLTELRQQVTAPNNTKIVVDSMCHPQHFGGYNKMKLHQGSEFKKSKTAYTFQSLFDKVMSHEPLY